MTAHISSPSDVVATAVRDCLQHELQAALAPAGATLRVGLAGLGTTAAHALKSTMLADALAAQRMEPGAVFVDTAITDVLAEPGWDLGLVLSPFKAEVGPLLDQLTPSARSTGIVDTLLRTDDGVLGVNTNSWALAGAVCALLPGVAAPRVLILGAGGTTRSALLGLGRARPDAQLFVSARRAEAVTELTARFAVTGVKPADTPEIAATVIVNSTTWGETAESEASPFGFPLERLLRPGGVLLDLNNRRSRLQEAALAAGCAVMSGTLMQRITHACRAASARWVRDGRVLKDGQ